jgi:hypothetical protein
MRRILLVEPGYKNKYPPLGLMKISAYHKRLGDAVVFVKGQSPELRAQTWDRIYIATLFTFFWKETLTTITYYGKSVSRPQDIVVGGILATLLGDELQKEVPVTIVRGILDAPGALDAGNKTIIDHLIPDYNILDTISYRYGVDDAYIGYATRGCPNACPFCAVRTLEPEFLDYMPLRHQVKGIESVYGQKRDLLLLDNNVLASRNFDQIICDIRDLGFERGAKIDKRERRVDFNQGIDARRLTKSKMQQLATIAIKPMRLAYDNSRLRERYEHCIRLAADHGILKHATYVLYNFEDTPADFYSRLRLNVDLNEKLGTAISSFPMKYIPLNSRDRTFIGKHWSKRMIRGVQCILLATRGMVSPRREFFEAAFGRSAEEFVQIALMPESYIIYRRAHESNGASDWLSLYNGLGDSQRERFSRIVARGRVTLQDVVSEGESRVKKLLRHYIEAETTSS